MTDEARAFWWCVRWGLFWTLVILLFGFNFLCCKSPADPEVEKVLEEVLEEARIVMNVSPNPLVVEPEGFAGWLPMTIRFTEHNGVSAELYNFGYQISFVGQNSEPIRVDFDDGQLDANGSLEFFKRPYIYRQQEPYEVEIWGQFTDENGHDIEVAKTIEVEERWTINP